jgi:hypothetical protein
MRNSLQREAAEAKKQKPVLPIFAWSISFGRTDRRASVWLKMSVFCPKTMANKLAGNSKRHHT